MGKFSMRKFVSLISLYSFLVCTFTGFILYIAPTNRVANNIKWTILSWERADYVNVHMVFSLILLIVIVLHIYYNFSAINQYLKLKWEGTSFLKSESFVAIVMIVLILIGTCYHIAPFSQIIKWREGAKNSWEQNTGIRSINSMEQSTDQRRQKNVRNSSF